MYESIKRIYARTLNVAYLNAAVSKGWITAEQKEQIINEVSL